MEDADYLLVARFREEDGENRYKVIGTVDGKLWTGGAYPPFHFGQEK